MALHIASIIVVVTVVSCVYTAIWLLLSHCAASIVLTLLLFSYQSVLVSIAINSILKWLLSFRIYLSLSLPLFLLHPFPFPPFSDIISRVCDWLWCSTNLVELAALCDSRTHGRNRPISWRLDPSGKEVPGKYGLLLGWSTDSDWGMYDC